MKQIELLFQEEEAHSGELPKILIRIYKTLLKAVLKKMPIRGIIWKILRMEDFL